MSILSSTGLGRDRAKMMMLYDRRALFYKEVENLTHQLVLVSWTPEKSAVYNRAEYNFILFYIRAYGWFDDVFVQRIKYPDFFTSAFGSVAMKVAAKTIGADLIPVQPMTAPHAKILYVDSL